jgi:large-conductance mechanosensitive channel
MLKGFRDFIMRRNVIDLAVEAKLLTEIRDVLAERPPV